MRPGGARNADVPMHIESKRNRTFIVRTRSNNCSIKQDGDVVRNALAVELIEETRKAMKKEKDRVDTLGFTREDRNNFDANSVIRRTN